MSLPQSTVIPVSYPVLFAVLTTLGALYVFLMRQHELAGHPRHDAQIAQLEARSESRLAEHIATEATTLARLEYALRRVESKQDWMLEVAGYGFPPRSPPLKVLDQRADGGTAPGSGGGP